MSKRRSQKKLDLLENDFCDHWDTCDNICLDCNKDLTEDKVDAYSDLEIEFLEEV